MNNLIRSAFLMAVAISGVLQVSAQTTSPRQGTGYNLAMETTVSGTIQEVRHQTNGRSSGTHLILNTDQGSLDVHVGPDWFLDQQKASFAAGDRVQVKGSQPTAEALIAREITKDGETLVLRTQQGFPLWSRGRRGQ